MAEKTAKKKWSNLRILGALVILAMIGGALWWLYPRADSPTSAYKRLYAAVKAKDTEAIKKELTQKSVDFGVMFSERTGKTIDQAYENGFTATTFSATLPEIRDERVKDNMGAVEVWNSKDKIWEDLPFINEDGRWKLAVGDVFAGTYEKPSESKASKEREAANAANGPIAPVQGMPNVNGQPMPMIPPNMNANKKHK